MTETTTERHRLKDGAITALAEAHKRELLLLVESQHALIGAIDLAEGEITPEQEAELDSVAMGLPLKAEAVALVCATLEAEARVCEDLAEKHLATAARKRGRIALLRHRLFTAMQLAGVDRAIGPSGGARIRSGNPAVHLSCAPEDVPDEFCERRRLVSRVKIGEALKAGRALTFARFERTPYLQWIR